MYGFCLPGPSVKRTPASSRSSMDTTKCPRRKRCSLRQLNCPISTWTFPGGLSCLSASAPMTRMKKAASGAFFRAKPLKRLKTKAYLSTRSCPQVELSAYFPQREESVGAKFVFPREVNGVPVLTKECSNITLELLDVPGTSARLRSTFAVKPMIVGDHLIF